MGWWVLIDVLGRAEQVLVHDRDAFGVRDAGDFAQVHLLHYYLSIIMRSYLPIIILMIKLATQQRISSSTENQKLVPADVHFALWIAFLPLLEVGWSVALLAQLALAQRCHIRSAILVLVERAQQRARFVEMVQLLLPHFQALNEVVSFSALDSADFYDSALLKAVEMEFAELSWVVDILAEALPPLESVIMYILYFLLML